MNTMKINLLLALFVLMGVSLRAVELGNAIGYQGRLIDGGVPANGSYDLRFAVFDSAQEGNQIGIVLTNAATPVADSLFAVTLDFEPGIFTGDARWLEIGVRAAGSPNAFTVCRLGNRLRPCPMRCMPPPRAMPPVSGPMAASQITGTLASSNIGAGTITAPQLASGAALPTSTPAARAA